jgi:phosphohistidine phosphatase
VDLILWRHAEAEDGVPDEERKLTGKGHKQAAKMARWLSEHLPKHYVLLVSPAKRTQQTAAALSAKFRTTEHVGLQADPSSLLQAADWPRAEGAVVVVGHQPTLGATAARLLGARDAEWAVRRGAIVWIAHKDGRASLRAALSPDLT